MGTVATNPTDTESPDGKDDNSLSSSSNQNDNSQETYDIPDFQMEKESENKIEDNFEYISDEDNVYEIVSDAINPLVRNEAENVEKSDNITNQLAISNISDDLDKSYDKVNIDQKINSENKMDSDKELNKQLQLEAANILLPIEKNIWKSFLQLENSDKKNISPIEEEITTSQSSKIDTFINKHDKMKDELECPTFRNVTNTASEPAKTNLISSHILPKSHPFLLPLRKTLFTQHQPEESNVNSNVASDNVLLKDTKEIDNEIMPHRTA
ncbi:hypothetical protein SNEBB_008579, partial [Seison nebaliae]